MKNTIPGDRNKSDEIARMIRVNHAGEYGAKRIYQGQLAILKGRPCEKIISHMAEQEQEHLDYFDKEIVDNKVRPTALMPLWHVTGFMLGAASAMLGEKSAMACTVAVEEVIDEHYSKQLDVLEEGELKSKIEKFRADELEHRDIGLDNNAEEAPAYPVLTSVVKAASKTAIWLSTRV